MTADDQHDAPDTEQPGCPICSKPMEFCDPSHEKAYWACPVDHEPPGIVQLADEVGYACALALVRVNDHFDEHGVEPFAGVDAPGDVPGLVVDLVLERIQHCVEFKRMRQREGYDELESTTGPDLDEAQTDLGRWSA